MQDKLSGSLICDFTTDVLKAFLSNSSENPPCQIKDVPFGQTIQLLKDDSNPIWKESKDFLVIWTQIFAAIPSFQRILRFEDVPSEDLSSECAAYVDAIKEATSRCRFVFVVTWTLPEYLRGYGPIDLKKANGWQRSLWNLNQQLVQELSDLPNVFLLNPEPWLRITGEKSCDPRLWFMGKIPFDPAVFKLAAMDIKAALRACLGQSRKVIFVDLDNTLWGGVVGDDGWEKLRIGGHDPQGEAFVEFQRILRSYKDRGIILAIVSKNDENIAWQVFDRHQEMILKKSDFVAWRINWQDKAQNISDLLKELNLTQEAAVFIDDNPAERARVQEALPGVFVPQWPLSSLLYPKALMSLTCFDTIHVSEDDRKRSQMYLQEKGRAALREESQSLEEWMVSLKTIVSIEPLTAANLPRATQLLNKTNQMNLATRRLSEIEFQQWAQASNHRVWVFRVQDKLGDSGLTGIASLRLDGSVAQIVDFILSCRVFGRQVENVMAQILVECSLQSAVKELRANYIFTEKNKPCLEFFQDRSGFSKIDDNIFAWDTSNKYPSPSHVTIQKL